MKKKKRDNFKKIGLQVTRYKIGDHLKLVYNQKNINLIANGILFNAKLLKRAKVWVNGLKNLFRLTQ